MINKEVIHIKKEYNNATLIMLPMFTNVIKYIGSFFARTNLNWIHDLGLKQVYVDDALYPTFTEFYLLFIFDLNILQSRGYLDLIRKHPSYVGEYSVDINLIAIKLNIPDIFLEDAKLIIQGKYDQVSKRYKDYLNDKTWAKMICLNNPDKKQQWQDIEKIIDEKLLYNNQCWPAPNDNFENLQ